MARSAGSGKKIKPAPLVGWMICLLGLAGPLLTACGEEEKPVLRPDAPAFTVADFAPTPFPTLPATPTPTPASEQAARIAAGELVVVELDTAQSGPEISPYIYGLAGADPADPAYTTNLKPGLTRWGGNPASRFNWLLGNAWNTGRDGGFINTDYGQPGRDVATEAVQAATGQKIPLLLTIPTLGWVARNNTGSVRSLEVPKAGGPPLAPGSAEIKGYNPAANQQLTSVKSVARKNAPFVTRPDPKSPVVYQDEWVASLVQRFGPARAGGVRFYAMDNEPDLWSETHTDVHPARMGYDALLERYVEYASAVKEVDPSAELTGPVVWGWNSYFWSELDRGEDNFKTAPDRARHANVPFVPWFLDQLRQYEQKNGQRILDVLDIHYYPQAAGLYSASGGLTDDKTNEVRLRSTRSLWHNTYVDESWINTPVRLIPRMREWINTYYPGTKLGISEWNFGADTTLNGALAIAQVLGIYGREGVYMAAYWRYPPAGSPGYYAFKLYTNFDDKGSRFGDRTLRPRLTDENRVNAFAALDTQSGRTRLILINTQPGRAQKIQVRLAKPLSRQLAGVYQLGAQTGLKLAAQTPFEVPGGTQFELTIPAYCATLLDLQP